MLPCIYSPILSKYCYLKLDHSPALAKEQDGLPNTVHSSPNEFWVGISRLPLPRQPQVSSTGRGTSR